VASDDLNAPLGRKNSKRERKLPASTQQLLAALLGLFGVAVMAFAVFVDDPLGGEPVAVVATVVLDEAKGSGQAGGDSRHHQRYDGPAAAAAAKAAGKDKDPATPPGAKTITIIDGSSGQSREVVIPGNAAAGAQQAPIDRNVLEPTRHGAVPKVGPDGARAFTLYAQARPISPNKKDWPRIAIVMTGLGISASGTADALAQLPAPVTLALTPYGADLDALATRARAKKHEVLLQVPMEPFDYPNNDPGPQTLLSSLTPAQNIDRLHWLMSRFQGYVGLIGYMGAKFTASDRALAPVVQEAGKRGLIYVDDGSSPRSVAGQLAGSQNLPYAKSDIVLDTVPTPAEIDRALARLEMAARERGHAIGIAAALPATVARIAAWAKQVEAKGFVLVPITQVAVKAKSS
jgi:hypothetical protein